MSPPYLLPISTAVELPEKTRAALEDLEEQFDLPTKKLEEIVEQMLWEFNEGLTKHATPETKDTFM